MQFPKINNFYVSSSTSLGSASSSLSYCRALARAPKESFGPLHSLSWRVLILDLLQLSPCQNDSFWSYRGELIIKSALARYLLIKNPRLRATYKNYKNMCLSPVYMRNPKKDFHALNDKTFLAVPCNHCEDCLQAKRVGYEIRAYYEYKHCIENGGSCYYYTLTYNNRSLPRFEIKSQFTHRTFQFPCFSREHLKRFQENFRKDLKIGDLFNSTSNIDCKFFITCEYGGDTRRPHYHLELFLNRQLDPMYVHLLFERNWKYGFVKAGDNNGLVYSPAAIQYVSKYIGKNEDYNDVLRRFTGAYSQSIDYYTFLNNRKDLTEIDIKKDEYIKLLKPFVYKSQHFGECAIDYMSKQNDLFGTIKFLQNGSLMDVPLPLYLLRKIYYKPYVNDKGYVIYQLNEKGVERKIALYDFMLQKRLDSFNDLSVNGVLPKQLQYHLQYHTGVVLDTYKDVYQYILDFVPNPIKLFQYDLVYRDRLVNGSLLLDSKQYLRYCLSENDTPPSWFKEDLMYNNLPCFANYDHCLFLIQLVKTYKAFTRYVKSYNKKLETNRLANKYIDKIHIASKYPPHKSLEEFSNLFNLKNQTAYVKSCNETKSASFSSEFDIASNYK